MTYFDTMPTLIEGPSLMILVLALLLEGVAGSPLRFIRAIPHPVALMGRCITLLDKKLNRPERSAHDRQIRGIGTVIIMITLSLAVALPLEWLFSLSPWGWVVESAFLILFFAQNELYGAVLAVAKKLKAHDLVGARKAVSHLVGRQTQDLGHPAVARAAIESLAENFSDAVVAPAFWYLIFGLKGLILYKCMNTMDSMIGYKTSRYKAFGQGAARLDDALNFIPARLSGLFLVFAAVFTATARPVQALKIMWTQASHHSSPNAGWPQAAMAGALDLCLVGPCTYGAHKVNKNWIGNGNKNVTEQEIFRSLYLYTLACLVHIIFLGILLVVILSL